MFNDRMENVSKEFMEDQRANLNGRNIITMCKDLNNMM